MEDIYFELRCLFPKPVAEIIMRDVVRNHEHKIIRTGMEYKCSICRDYSFSMYTQLASWLLPKMYNEYGDSDPDSEYEKAKRHFESLK